LNYKLKLSILKIYLAFLFINYTADPMPELKQLENVEFGDESEDEKQKQHNERERLGYLQAKFLQLRKEVGEY
jgi:hypothetical protein